jgi:hypothetical protein
MLGKNPSKVEIAEMMAKGFDSTTIAQAQKQAERWTRVQMSCALIQDAFAGVKLGNGVGLMQAQGLDDYADSATCASYRAHDEKDDWRRISPDALNRCFSSLSFFEAEGMRFHLPAYLIGYLQDTFKGEIMFTLTHLNEYSEKQFALLSGIQRNAVRAFLEFHLEDPGSSIHHVDISRALSEYWIATKQV